MTLQEKQNFVAGALGNVEQRIMDKLGKMPESWDGKELRWFIADHFEQIVWNAKRDKREKRYNDYYNLCLVDNLI